MTRPILSQAWVTLESAGIARSFAIIWTWGPGGLMQSYTCLRCFNKKSFVDPCRRCSPKLHQVLGVIPVQSSLVYNMD